MLRPAGLAEDKGIGHNVEGVVGAVVGGVGGKSGALCNNWNSA